MQVNARTTDRFMLCWCRHSYKINKDTAVLGSCIKPHKCEPQNRSYTCRSLQPLLIKHIRAFLYVLKFRTPVTWTAGSKGRDCLYLSLEKPSSQGNCRRRVWSRCLWGEWRREKWQSPWIIIMHIPWKLIQYFACIQELKLRLDNEERTWCPVII